MAREALTFFDQDGYPWAIFVWGCWPLHDVTDAIRTEFEKIADQGEAFPADDIDHHWIVRDEEDDPDHPYKWCDPDVPGATPITGIRY